MGPHHLALLAVAAAAAALIICWRLRPALGFSRALPYSRREGLLSRGELAFYRVLLSAIPAGTVLVVKVRLAVVVSVPANAWQEYGGPVAGMHLDFLVCDAGSMAFLLAVELDDRTHERPRRRERDVFVDAVLASAGLPLLRVKAAAQYSVGELRALVGGPQGVSFPGPLCSPPKGPLGLSSSRSSLDQNSFCGGFQPITGTTSSSSSMGQTQHGMHWPQQAHGSPSQQVQSPRSGMRQQWQWLLV